MLARRELSVSQVRHRLADREHSQDAIDSAIEVLLESRALDDTRVAKAYARTASNIKGRGRLRVQRELQEMGISKDIAAEAIAEVFGDLDERALIDKAIKKKLRFSAGPRRTLTLQERSRLYQFLMRQGFTPAGISAALRKIGASPEAD